MNYHRFMASGDTNRFELFGQALYYIDSLIFRNRIFPFFFAGHALITLFGVYKFIVVFSEDKLFSIFIFFTIPVLYLSSLNLVRQWAAVGLLYSVFADAYSGKEVWKMWVRLMLLPMIHLSSILVLPLFLLVLREWNVRIVLFSGITAFFLFTRLLNILLSTKYAFYIEHRLFSKEPYSLQLFLYPIFLMVVGYIIKRNQKNTGNGLRFEPISKLVAFSCVLMLMAIYLNIDERIITRVGTYFFLLIVVLLPRMFSVLLMYGNILRSVFLLSFSFLFLRLVILYGSEYSLVPYRTILF